MNRQQWLFLLGKTPGESRKLLIRAWWLQFHQMSRATKSKHMYWTIDWIGQELMMFWWNCDAWWSEPIGCSIFSHDKWHILVVVEETWNLFFCPFPCEKFCISSLRNHKNWQLWAEKMSYQTEFSSSYQVFQGRASHQRVILTSATGQIMAIPGNLVTGHLGACGGVIVLLTPRWK